MPISATRGVFGAGVSFADGIASYAGSVGGGTATAFGLGSFGVVHYDDLDFDTWTVGGVAGGQVAADPARRVVICPFGLLAYEWRNDIQDLDVSISGLTTGAGVSAGFVAAETPTLQVVPALGLSVNRARVTFTDDFFDDEIVETRTYGLVNAGLALVLNGRSAITFGIGVPFGIDDGEVSFLLSFSTGFGGT